MHGEGGMHGMHSRSLRGRYASYWKMVKLCHLVTIQTSGGTGVRVGGHLCICADTLFF